MLRKDVFILQGAQGTRILVMDKGEAFVIRADITETVC